LYWTSLHWAAQKQDAEILNLLLDYGANPNCIDFEGATPLHVAGDSTSHECVKLLIQYGADPSIRNNFGSKAADLCIKRGHSLEKEPMQIFKLEDL